MMQVLFEMFSTWQANQHATTAQVVNKAVQVEVGESSGAEADHEDAVQARCSMIEDILLAPPVKYKKYVFKRPSTQTRAPLKSCLKRTGTPMASR
eukprot:10083758-Karenia_brevis.AAC.1